MGEWIKCCRYCVPPKRHAGCHGSCEDYAIEKAEHEEKKAKREINKRKHTQIDDYEYIKMEKHAHRKHLKNR